jgi:hypothetical protein
MAWTLKRDRGRDILRARVRMGWRRASVYLGRRRWGFDRCLLARRTAEKRPITEVISRASSASLEKKFDRPTHREPPARTQPAMHKISRTSLASLVCPSAPFLAPPLLRTAIPVAVHTSQCPPFSRLQTACYATKTKEKGPPRKLTFSPRKKNKPAAVDNEVRRAMIGIIQNY